MVSRILLLEGVWLSIGISGCLCYIEALGLGTTLALLYAPRPAMWHLALNTGWAGPAPGPDPGSPESPEVRPAPLSDGVSNVPPSGGCWRCQRAVRVSGGVA